MNRYVVIGAGAVGATLAAELHRAGTAVVLVAGGTELSAPARGGLRHRRPDGEHVVDLPVAAGPGEVALRAQDVLVLATGSHDAEAALADWAWRPVDVGVGEDGAGRARPAAETLPVVTLQDGLDAERVALRRFATVYGAVVWSPAGYVTPGEARSPAAPVVGAVWLGRYPSGGDPGDEGVAGIAADLRAARYLAEVVDDVPRWKAGALLAVLGIALDHLYAPGPVRDRAVTALRAEAMAVYRAAGITPADLVGAAAPDPSVLAAPGPPADRPPTGRSSGRNVVPGGPSETDFLHGEIALLARSHGTDAPRNAAVQARLQRAVREGTTAGSLGGADLLEVLPEIGVLVDADALAAELAGPRPPVLLDVRWALGDPHGRTHHREAHLPGAVYVDLDTELAGHTGDPTDGRHPLPEVSALQAAARRWGIGIGRPVVAYDATGGLAAARAWWLLRWAGLSDVRLLDGGLPAWSAAGHPVEAGAVPPPDPGDVELTGGHLPVLDADGAAALADGGGVLLDARAGERYRGEVEPIDPRAGHIPGARSAPTSGNLRPDGRFRSGVELRARFAGLGAPAPVGVYCGSGVTAAHQIAALAAIGEPAALYPGSWSAWSSDPARPAATGAEPGHRPPRR